MRLGEVVNVHAPSGTAMGPRRLTDIVGKKAVSGEETVEEEKKDDLFDLLNALFQGRRVEKPLASIVLHRFLASDPDYAEVARTLSVAFREDDLVWGFWIAALPHSAGAPRLRYCGPPRAAAAEALVKRLMVVHAYRRPVAEESVRLLELAGYLPTACAFYGVEEKS